MKPFSIFASLGLILTSLSFAGWPTAGWKGPYYVRAAPSQFLTTNSVYTWNFYISGAAESGSWCGSDYPLKFYFSSGEQSYESAVAAQATVLSALTAGFQIKAKFKGYDGCAIEDVIICYDGANCNPQ